jgi:hypothetical protein
VAELGLVIFLLLFLLFCFFGFLFFCFFGFWFCLAIAEKPNRNYRNCQWLQSSERTIADVQCQWLQNAVKNRTPRGSPSAKNVPPEQILPPQNRNINSES